MTRRPCLKWNYFEPDVLCAWVAEMDFGLAPSVSRALHEAVDFADTGYPYPALERAVAEAATRFWGARFGWVVDPARVFPAPDVIEAGRRAVTHLTPPGSPVILHTPVYFPFFSMVESAGREVIQVPSPKDGEGRHHLDIPAIDRALDSGAGSIILCNPWNPVGRSLSEGEVREVIDVASAHGAKVISDEIHGALVFDGGRHIPAASIAPDTVITVTSASKAWNTPGLKTAQVVLTNDDDLDVWAGYFTPEKVGVGTFGLIAGEAAYDRGVGWLDEVMVQLESNRKHLTTFIEERMPRVGYSQPEATFLAWLDLTSYGWEDPAAYILEHARVALTGGGPFGIGGEGHVRLNFGTDEGILTQIMERLASVL
jgi:cysteine-S-conjugate beta-lyase